MKNINNLIEEAKERVTLAIEQEREDKQEKERYRSLQEAERIIDYFKRQHRRKKKTYVGIYITTIFVLELERTFYQLRLSVDGCVGDIYNLEEKAGITLVEGVPFETYGGFDWYKIYTNKE